MNYIQIFWHYRNIEVNLNLKFSSIPTTDHFDLNFLQLFCRGTQIFIFYYYLSFSPFSFIISFLFYYCLSYRILTSHFISFSLLFSSFLFSSLLFSSIILISNLFNKWHLSFISSNENYFILFYFSISSPSIHILSSSFSPYQLILFLVRCSLFFIFNISNLGIFWSLT